jgi:hypothetical protein
MKEYSFATLSYQVLCIMNVPRYYVIHTYNLLLLVLKYSSHVYTCEHLLL